MTRAEKIAAIRRRRQTLKVSGKRMPAKRRPPRQLYPHALEREYTQAVLRVLAPYFEEASRTLSAALPAIVAARDAALRADGAVIRTDAGYGDLKKADAAQAKADTLSEENKQLKADLDPAGEKIQAIIADRKALEEVAGKLSIKADGLTNQALKVAVIQKQSPEFRTDGRSDDYVNARYDSVVELLDAAAKEGGQTALAQVIRDARGAATLTIVDHRAEFIKKSQALNETDK